MEQEIYFTDKDFDFSQIMISQPVSVQGGAYFTKIKYNTTPLYIQLPKCYTKQGLNETNKKAYIDLMFTNDDNEVVEWFEHLEETLVELIYEKRELWFQNEMDKEDIENFFNPVCRSFKGGKFHLIRFNVPKNKTINSRYNCNMYDENENMIPIQDLNEGHSIIPCLEVQGIKFSARNFQVELVGKQIMLINNKPLFTSCIIKRDVKPVTPEQLNNDIVTSETIASQEVADDTIADDTIANETVANDTIAVDTINNANIKDTLATYIPDAINDTNTIKLFEDSDCNSNSNRNNQMVDTPGDDIENKTVDNHIQTLDHNHLEETVVNHIIDDDSIKGLQRKITDTLADSDDK
jgi:hypothetical protein